MSADKVFHPRSQGIPSEGVKDQYADGKAAKVWKMFIGDITQRTQNYRDFLIGLLQKHGCSTVLDAACGTGIDSMMLVDAGFKVVSVDASDKMLKHALKSRWDKRRNHKYDEWVIEEANWETLSDDISKIVPGTLFDAVICLGNSFAHLLDADEHQSTQRMCLENFSRCLKPGGLLFIDHRNYDAMIDSGATPATSIYYNCAYPVEIKTSVLVVAGRPQLIALDYCIDATADGELSEPRCGDQASRISVIGEISEFRLCYYPHKLDKFTRMLDEAFGEGAIHEIYADFKPMEQVPNPGFYIHVLQKPK